MAKPKTQLESAYHWEKTTPDRVWMTQPTGGGATIDLTFKEGMDQARRLASYLKSLNLPEKSKISLFSKNSAYWILADLGIWMAGHVSVPIYPTLTHDTIRHIIDHSESKAVIIGKLDGYEAMAPGIPDGLPLITTPLCPSGIQAKTWDEIMAENEPLEGDTERAPDDLATIVYTSGSTGLPKGVMHSFKTMSVAAESMIQTLGGDASDRMLSYLPLAHVFERLVVETNGLFAGYHIFFAESLDTFVEDLKRASPTIFVSVPRLWSKFQLGVFQKMPPGKLKTFLKIPILNSIVRKKVLTGLGLQDVRFAGSGSAPIPGELIQWYRDLGLELLEGYGMSENFALSHCSQPGKVRVGYVGNTYGGVDCKLSEEGEILVKSPGSMLGYYKMEEETKACFTDDGYLKTGDRGEIDEQGRLKITGRVKELFKTSKGKYVAPAPIENKLMNHDSVEQAYVGGNGQPQPYGVVMLSEPARAALSNGGKDSLAQALEAHLASVNGELAAHEKLQFVAITSEEWTIENGFLTPTMKLKRRAIEEAYQPREGDWYQAGAKVVWG